MNNEIGQLEGKRAESAEKIIQRKTQLADRAAELTRNSARPCQTKRLPREIGQLYTRIKCDIGLIVKEKTATQAWKIYKNSNQNPER